MTWIAIAGLALMLASAYGFGHVSLRRRLAAGAPREQPPSAAAAPAVAVPPATEENALEARVRRAATDQTSRDDLLWLRGAWAAALAGTLLLAVATLPTLTARPGGSVLGPIAGASQAASGSLPAGQRDVGHDALLLWYALTGLFVVVGGALALLARQTWVKASGVASMALAAGLHGTTLFKIEKFLALDNKFDFSGAKLDIELAVRKQLEAQSRFRPQYLGGVQSFALGRATLDEDGFDRADALAEAKSSLQRICATWKDQPEHQDALVLIVGGTDRLALAGAARSRYEANAGLAQARAASLREYLEQHCWSPQVMTPGRVLLLASGPGTTPDKPSAAERSSGYPQDRRADVWVLSTVTPPPIAKPR